MVRFVPLLLSLLLAAACPQLAFATEGESATRWIASGPPPAERTVEVNVPAQSTANALLALSRQAKIEVLFSFNALRKERSAELKGRFTPEEALTRLLRGTGFTFNRMAEAKFVIVAEAQPTGSIEGRLLTPERVAAAGVRVVLPMTRHSTTTDHEGRFTFSRVIAGTYRLVATAEGCEPLQIGNLKVSPGETLVLPPHTFLAADRPAQLERFVVADTGRENPLDRSEAMFAPRTAAGNLDLARTESDALPFTIYNRAQIARSGVVNLNEFLQRELLDSDAGTRPPEQDGSKQTFQAGSTNLNLRGYGADQTIILVNGRRLPEALTNGGDTMAPDVNFIPLSLVQQVEVLPISASSLYTGNAVGGVINIVLRPGVDSEATEVALTYTNAIGRYDAPQSSLSLLHSRALLGGRLRMRFNASSTRATPPTETELRYHRTRFRTPAPLHAPVFRATPNVRNARLIPIFAPGTTLVSHIAPAPLFGPSSASVTSVAPGADGAGGIAPFLMRRGVRNFDFYNSPGGLATSLDSIDYPYGREQQRSAYFASAVYDIAPWLQLGFDGMFTRTVVHRGYDVFAADLRLDASSRLNPFGQDVLVSLNETPSALGEHYNEARLDFGSGILAAMFTLPADWRVLLDGQYGRNIARYRGLSGADYGRWQSLVDRGAYNPLRDTQAFGPPKEFYDEVLIYRGSPGRFVTLGDYHTWDAALRITNTKLPLPTGRGILNFGGDYRRNELAKHHDVRQFADGTVAGTPLRWAGRTIRRYSVFAELQAPLLPPGRLPRGVRNVDTDLAVRYIASDSSREASTAPTVGLKVNLAGGFTLRGSLTTSSRFPTPQMSRLALSPSFGGGPGTAGVDLQYIYDPVRKESYGVQEHELIDPDLRPEGAVTQTAGIIFQRGRVHRFRAAVDFVDTRKTNELLPLDPQTVLTLEDVLPDRVERAPLAPGESHPSGRVRSVITGTINMAWRRSNNWNTSFDYSWTQCFGGTLDLYARLLYFPRYDRQLLRTSPVVDELGHPEGGATGLLKYRAKFGAGWANRDYGFGLDGHYFHSRILPRVERTAQGRDRIQPYWQFDAFTHVDLGRWLHWMPNGLRAQLRVNNVLGFDFPNYANEASGAGVQPYGDWRGRVYSLSLMTTF
jgi:iron complex outermembrane recepter protein